MIIKEEKPDYYALVNTTTGKVVVYNGKKMIFRYKFTCNQFKLKISKIFLDKIELKGVRKGDKLE